MKQKRVVITGMGVVAPGAVGLRPFTEMLKEGRSGIAYIPELEDLGFRSHVGGVPPVTQEHLDTYFEPLDLVSINADGIRFGCLAGAMAWKDSGLGSEHVDEDSGAVFGAGMPGADVVAEAVRNVDAHRVKKLGSKTVPNTMSSGVSAFLGGHLGLGNQVTTNASACATGTEAILLGYQRIQSGLAKRMLCGACDSAGVMVRSGFDAMRVLSSKFNDRPVMASRPMSATACGFVASGGSGALVLESLDSAIKRGAKIYAEVLGGFVNSGGQRNGGSMTAPNPDGIIRCIHGALKSTGLSPDEIDTISGHLTATTHDPREIKLWCRALGSKGKDFPLINSLKSLTGHCLSAAGAIEAVASLLQLTEGFVHPSINCEDLHPEISGIVSEERIPRMAMPFDGKIALSASFGFGDVNAIVIFRKMDA